MKATPPMPNPMQQMMQQMMGMMAGGGGGAAMMPGGAAKEKLVARIKEFQKENEQQKEIWGSFCDSQLGGKRDPMRHDVSVLQRFCVSQGLSLAGVHGLPSP